MRPVADFAVVAAEVKGLAAQTAKATDEITVQIATIQEATRDTVGAIEEIGSTIGTVHTIAMGVAAAVEQQQVATQEIARSVNDAARGTQAVTETIADVQLAAVQTRGRRVPGSGRRRAIDAAIQQPGQRGRGFRRRHPRSLTVLPDHLERAGADA